MAFFAQVDENNLVIEVLKTDDSWPEKGKLWLEEKFGGTWLETERETESERLRKNFACKGFTYNTEADAFVPPQPYDSFILDTNDYQWKPPIPYPEDGKSYVWDEQTTSWVEVTLETE